MLWSPTRLVGARLTANVIRYKYMRLLRTLSIGVLTIVTSTTAMANDDVSPRHALAVAKMAGACGVLDSLIQFQKTTRMEGGESFVLRFWKLEAARLGMSVEGLSQRCDESIANYRVLWDASGDVK